MGICSTELHQDAEDGPPETLDASVWSSSLGVNPQRLFPLMSEEEKLWILFIFYFIFMSPPVWPHLLIIWNLRNSDYVQSRFLSPTSHPSVSWASRSDVMLLWPELLRHISLK